MGSRFQSCPWLKIIPPKRNLSFCSSLPAPVPSCERAYFQHLLLECSPHSPVNSSYGSPSLAPGQVIQSLAWDENVCSGCCCQVTKQWLTLCEPSFKMTSFTQSWVWENAYSCSQCCCISFYLSASPWDNFWAWEKPSVLPWPRLHRSVAERWYTKEDWLPFSHTEASLTLSAECHCRSCLPTSSQGLGCPSWFWWIPILNLN